VSPKEKSGGQESPFERFESFVRRVVNTPKSEIDKKAKEEEEEKARLGKDESGHPAS
jgi:hypothetical protein